MLFLFFENTVKEITNVKSFIPCYFIPFPVKRFQCCCFVFEHVGLWLTIKLTMFLPNNPFSEVHLIVRRLLN